MSVGIKPNPDDCKSYKKCLPQAYGSPFGTWSIVACDYGLLFGSNANECVEPSKADCQKCRRGEKIPTVDCSLHWHCNGTSFIQLRCPTIPVVQIFDPDTNECTTKKKLIVPGKCNTFKECASKWTVTKCEKSLYFDSFKQECVDANLSMCGK